MFWIQIVQDLLHVTFSNSEAWNDGDGKTLSLYLIVWIIQLSTSSHSTIYILLET